MTEPGIGNLSFRTEVSPEEIARRNSEIYDGAASDPVFRMIVYDSLHRGWDFINLGGSELLDAIARRHALAPGSAMLELGCGTGDTCRYLAERHGLRVTGVDMNPRQVARARARLAEVPPEVADRLEFVEADILRWHSSRLYDGACSADALMLVPDVPGFFAVARESLSPGRRLSVATLCAGPRADARILRFAWEVDGMISLLPPEELRAALADAGFVEIEEEDLTPLACRSSDRMAKALAERRAEVVRAQGEEGFQGWWQVGEVYRAGFHDGRLLYSLLTARRA